MSLTNQKPSKFLPSLHISISHLRGGKVSPPSPGLEHLAQAAGRGAPRQLNRGPGRDEVHHGHGAVELSPRQLLRQQRCGGLAETPRHQGAVAEGGQVGLVDLWGMGDDMIQKMIL